MSDVIARGGAVGIRRMQDSVDDYQRIVEWRNTPHVREWWDPDDPPMTIEDATREYRDYTGRDAETLGCIIEVDGKPVGFVQLYPWGAYAEELRAVGVMLTPGAWGLDIFIGEVDAIGCGVGSQAVALVNDYMLNERGASSVVLACAAENGHAQRAYTRAGMRRGDVFLDTDTRDGVRMLSLLMIRDGEQDARA